MTDNPAGGLKRPLPDEESSSAQKRSRSNTGSPLPHTNGAAQSGKPDINKILADARAKASAAAARLQSIKLGSDSFTPALTSSAPS